MPPTPKKMGYSLISNQTPGFGSVSTAGIVVLDKTCEESTPNFATLVTTCYSFHWTWSTDVIWKILVYLIPVFGKSVSLILETYDGRFIDSNALCLVAWWAIYDVRVFFSIFLSLKCSPNTWHFNQQWAGDGSGGQCCPGTCASSPSDRTTANSLGRRSGLRSRRVPRATVQARARTRFLKGRLYEGDLEKGGDVGDEGLELEGEEEEKALLELTTKKRSRRAKRVVS